jgi:tetratricopeptide (TPR) repeat protein
MDKTLLLLKNPIALVVLFAVAGIGAFFGFQYVQNQKELRYFEGLAAKRPDGAVYVEQLLKARQELKDKDAGNDFAAYTNIGVNLNIFGEKEEALKWYEKALLIDPESLLVLNNVADIYSDLGNYDKAEQNWLKLTELYPDKTMFYRSLGYLYWYRMQKSPQDIEALFKKVLETTDNNTDLLTWLISYFSETGNNVKFAEYANLLNTKKQ